MRLELDESLRRVAAELHATLATSNADGRGIDLVPVVYALHERFVGIPIDTVKPKASTRLQRERNLEADPRATLLVEHWDHDDWSQLWWVRLRVVRVPDPGRTLVDALSDRLATAHPAYHHRPFAGVLILRIVEVRGWSAEAEG